MSGYCGHPPSQQRPDGRNRHGRTLSFPIVVADRPAFLDRSGCCMDRRQRRGAELVAMNWRSWQRIIRRDGCVLNADLVANSLSGQNPDAWTSSRFAGRMCGWRPPRGRAFAIESPLQPPSVSRSAFAYCAVVGLSWRATTLVLCSRFVQQEPPLPMPKVLPKGRAVNPCSCHGIARTPSGHLRGKLNEILGLYRRRRRCRFFCSASFGPQPNHDVDTADFIALGHWGQLADN
jgi:hypothetical protein